MSATAFQKKRREEAAQLEELQQTSKQEDEQGFDKLTNDQLKALLEEKGIEYKKSATKAELIELLQGTDI